MTTENTQTPASTTTAQTPKKPFAIEKNIRIPTGTALDRFPFSEMEIGDSFFVPTAELSENSVRSYVSRYGKDRTDVAFKTATIEGGVRVWRVEPKKPEASPKP